MHRGTPLLEDKAQKSTPIRDLTLAVAACLATTALSLPLHDHFDQANIVMLFLLTVLLVAVKLGRNAAVVASILGVLFFDFFFVTPRFSLAVSDLQYLVTFSVMLVTALTSAQLTAGLRQKAGESARREQRTLALYDCSRRLAGALTVDQLVEVSQSFIREQFAAPSTILLPADGPDALRRVSANGLEPIEPAVAKLVFDSGQTVRGDELGAIGVAPIYLPLRGSTRIRGVLAVGLDDEIAESSPEATSLLETLASLIAVGVERLHYADVARETEVSMSTERLRSSILSALSHDLRTPLTAMVGLADSLFLIKPQLPSAALETAQALREQADRLAGLVGNLLDMARLNAGQVTLRLQWHPLEEVIGASIKLLAGALTGRPVRVSLPRDLPLLHLDAVLIERVLCNLLENAAKYSPAQAPIEVSARPTPDTVEVSVCDHGSGFPAQAPAELFRMFVRGQSESGPPGAGLGLAICKAIVEAHGGKISAGNRPEGGACVRFTLPRGTPPVVEEEEP
ncbi:DUF4118 domain-containing protein [Accumulibacter sp.]|uniref:DUF4118 domain-containing protein n=1 Tax=Accumulibacter sp. TaxID=2053492 RepID=UPI0025DF31F0|nr:DUF4118 domain-containing protein [Accumulibacter sp.]MCM8594834.1 DUF4118 domain-containing protein [Accumulibacter sp.]MCM8625656.1 DUF4118 domain-containing protein [Accumulibacter sp.]MDS4048980.1 DUF4118 domain-containing protein [Accumulibacter sp.]